MTARLCWFKQNSHQPGQLHCASIQHVPEWPTKWWQILWRACPSLLIRQVTCPTAIPRLQNRNLWTSSSSYSLSISSLSSLASGVDFFAAVIFGVIFVVTRMLLSKHRAKRKHWPGPKCYGPTHVSAVASLIPRCSDVEPKSSRGYHHRDHYHHRHQRRSKLGGPSSNKSWIEARSGSLIPLSIGMVMAWDGLARSRSLAKGTSGTRPHKRWINTFPRYVYFVN